MRCVSKTVAIFLVIVLSNAYAGEFTPFSGQVNTDNVNIRSGSTVNAQIVCKVSKGDSLEVILEAYDWYKIKLPKTAHSYIRKDLVSIIEPVPSISPSLAVNSEINIQAEQAKSAKVIKDEVNIRLFPSESSSIIGKAEKNEIINIVGREGDWYKITPLNSCFGWINKKFIDRTALSGKYSYKQSALPNQIPGQESKGSFRLNSQEGITVEGVIQPYGKVFKRSATHKLILNDKKTFLLKGQKNNLDALNYHKVRITGKVISSPSDKTPLIEIQKLEAAD